MKLNELERQKLERRKAIHYSDLLCVNLTCQRSKDLSRATLVVNFRLAEAAQMIDSPDPFFFSRDPHTATSKDDAAT